MTKGGHSATATFSRAVVAPSCSVAYVAEAKARAVTAKNSLRMTVEGFLMRIFGFWQSCNEDIVDLKLKFTHVPKRCLHSFLANGVMYITHCFPTRSHDF